MLAGADVDHASIYMLEVDEDSRLGREISNGGLKYYAPQVPSDDAIAEMYLEGCAFLEKAGLAQYEISNFAKRGAESRHNLKYWKRETYLGLGLDAHSMLRTESGAAVRFATTEELQPFLEDAGWDEARTLAREAELEEAWFLGLRLNRGVDLAALRAEFGAAAVKSFEPMLVELECDALVEWEGDRVSLTERGRLMSNEVFAQFLAEPALA
jgi:oxygen-independent coproporphyrinogen-3 oxidase